MSLFKPKRVPPTLSHLLRLLLADYAVPAASDPRSVLGDRGRNNAKHRQPHYCKIEVNK